MYARSEKGLFNQGSKSFLLLSLLLRWDLRPAKISRGQCQQLAVSTTIIPLSWRRYDKCLSYVPDRRTIELRNCLINSPWNISNLSNGTYGYWLHITLRACFSQLEVRCSLTMQNETWFNSKNSINEVMITSRYVEAHKILAELDDISLLPFKWSGMDNSKGDFHHWLALRIGAQTGN